MEKKLTLGDILDHLKQNNLTNENNIEFLIETTDKTYKQVETIKGLLYNFENNKYMLILGDKE